MVAPEAGGAAKIFPSYYASIPLHKTNYYGSLRERDPYQMFYIEHLHPYYLFSAPWLKKDRYAANNDTVNRAGFRDNPSFEPNKTTGVFLGGSAAFGQYATSNDMTIAAQLSRLGDLKFINLNAPSWNSHQAGDDTCGSEVARSILLNQQNMKLISEARGARHVLVIQPQFSLHSSARSEFKVRTQEDLTFRRSIIRKIMNSDFCRRDCLDLSTVFDRTPEGATTAKELNNEFYSAKAFADEVHLTDYGNRIVSQPIAAYLQSGLAP